MGKAFVPLGPVHTADSTSPLHLDQGLGFRDGALFEENAGPNTHLRCISSNTVS